MPLIHIETTQAIDDEQVQTLAATITNTVSEITGKGRPYIMVTLTTCRGTMGGEPGPAALVDVRGIGGLHDTTNRHLAEAICRHLQELADIPPERTFLNFTSFKGYNWGWNGKLLNR